MNDSVPQTGKRCSQCGIIKPLTEFFADRRKRDGRDYRCKNCQQKAKSQPHRRAQAREYRRRIYHTNKRVDRAVADESGFVYVIRSGGYFKIGLSAYPVERIASIQAASPHPIEAICIIETNNMIRLERKLHAQFHHARKHGEWFELSDQDVEQIKHMTE